MTPARVLVVDDKENILGLFSRILGSAYQVATALDGQRGLAMALAGDFDVVVSDIRMPGADGFELLGEIKRSKPDVEVILMTAYGSVQKAVEAVKLGAYDYLTKPFEPDEALITVQKAVELKRLREQARDLKAALHGASEFQRLVGRSAQMQKVFDLLRRAASSDATVLITGESGTGKEIAARAIHVASTRRVARFVPVNCGAIPEALVESELFGHVRGSFTGATSDRRGLFEEAHGGTLFLDEVGELPLAMQVKLTRALQERSIRRVGESAERQADARVVAATNANLEAAVAAGAFREDLFYRLNVFPLKMPALRDRRDDVPLLVAHFLAAQGGRYGGTVDGFSAEALTALVRYDWPGNVRQLENAIERALAVVEGPRIPLEALPDEIAACARPRSGSLVHLSYREAVDLARDRASREYLIDLMRELGGSVTRAAERAGMERETLHRLLKRYGLRSEEFKGTR